MPATISTIPTIWMGFILFPPSTQDRSGAEITLYAVEHKGVRLVQNWYLRNPPSTGITVPVI